MLQELQENPWDFKVQLPILSDWKSIQFNGKDMGEWHAFACNLKPGDFREGVVEWCKRTMCKMYKYERDCYTQYIQAQNPSKRIKIQAGQVLLQ